jgi:hypothetical protein
VIRLSGAFSFVHMSDATVHADVESQSARLTMVSAVKFYITTFQRGQYVLSTPHCFLAEVKSINFIVKMIGANQHNCILQIYHCAITSTRYLLTCPLGLDTIFLETS